MPEAIANSIPAAVNVEHAGASLLDQIVGQSKVAKSTSEHARAKDIIAELVQEVMNGSVVMSSNLCATLDARVAQLDTLISEQLSAVMHALSFSNSSQAGGVCIICANRPQRVRC